VKATHADELAPSVDREQVARTFMRAVLKQVMIDGFFHADPHPGNIVLDTKTGRVTFLDLGLVGEIEAEQRIDLLALLWALRMKQPRALATVSLRLCVATGDFDEGAYRADVERLYFQYWVYGGASFSGMVSALSATLRKHGLRMRKELTLAVKSITQAEELLRAIRPDMKLVDVATEEVEWLVRDELTSNRLVSLAESQVAQVVSSLITTANERRTDLGPLLVEALLGGRFDAPRPAGAPELSGVYERLDTLLARIDRLGQRVTTVTGAVGLAVALAIVLGAVVLNPAVVLDGTVLVVSALATLGIGWLGWMTYRGRGTP
jgi:ubiquinone biosynthesis protein